MNESSEVVECLSNCCGEKEWNTMHQYSTKVLQTDCLALGGVRLINLI